MLTRWFIPLFALPGTVLVIIPAAITWVAAALGSAPQFAQWHSIQFWLGAALSILGGFFAIWSAAQFFCYGKGTPAPWDPPRQFVARGPYRHVRNPMIVGVVMLLFAEALLVQSWWLAAWGLVFLTGNAVYLPLVEEPALARRFGNDYIQYCQNVRRWLPRIPGWHSTHRVD